MGGGGSVVIAEFINRVIDRFQIGTAIFQPRAVRDRLFCRMNGDNLQTRARENAGSDKKPLQGAINAP